MKSKTACPIRLSVFNPLIAAFGLAVIIFAILLSGCATTSTSTLYSVPSWMPDGRIICGKLVVTTSQQLYGGGISSSHSYVAAFYPSGTGEVNLFEGGVGDGVNVMTCSPTGEMIAGIGDGKIIISDYKGNMSTIPEARKELWGGELWTDGYYIGTVGEHGIKQKVMEYVKTQGSRRVENYEQLKLF